jgi:predicted Zn-dependent protease
LSDADKQRILSEIKGDRSATAEYHAGVGAFARRRFLEAEAAFRRAEKKEPGLDFLRVYRAYALCLAGRREAANRLFLESKKHARFDVKTWAWLIEKYSLGS